MKNIRNIEKAEETLRKTTNMCIYIYNKKNKEKL